MTDHRLFTLIRRTNTTFVVTNVVFYGAPIYLLVTLLAFLSPIASLVGCLVFAAYWALPVGGPTNPT